MRLRRKPPALRALQRYRFALVLAVAFIIRIVDVSGSPVELGADELAGLVGVNNIWAGRAPLVPFFDLRVQYLPLYGLLETVSTWIFGTNALGIRLPAVLLGVVSVAALRWLVFELTESFALADGSAAIFAVLPWAVDVSRLGWENAAVFPFLLGGLAALARGLRRRDSRAVVASGWLFGIGAYSYRAEVFDAVLLAASLGFADARRARACRGALIRGVLVAGCTVAPLGISVARTPHFFWRDANIATFGHGYTLAAFVTFVHNYLAHFAIVPLFATGDGILDHGPAYGVLYWWMLPFIILGALTAPRVVRPQAATFLYAWLLIYPLGGALTNDGVPDFPRTMIGAPLFCIFAAIGLRGVWRALGAAEAGDVRVRTVASGAFALVATLATLDFARAYVYVYPGASADAFKSGTANLFHTLRTLERGHDRVCFASLDWYNYATLTDYYLAGSSLVPIEGIAPDCRLAGSLIVVDEPSKTVPHSHLIAIGQKRNGAIMAYIYET